MPCAHFADAAASGIYEVKHYCKRRDDDSTARAAGKKLIATYDPETGYDGQV